VKSDVGEVEKYVKTQIKNMLDNAVKNPVKTIKVKIPGPIEYIWIKFKILNGEGQK